MHQYVHKLSREITFAHLSCRADSGAALQLEPCWAKTPDITEPDAWTVMRPHCGLAAQT